MQCYTELLPPTAVTHALCLPFLSPKANNLVVARTSLLQIFGLKVVSQELDRDQDGSAKDIPQPTDRRILDDDGLDESFIAPDLVLQKSERVNTTKLVLIAEYPLSGTVTSLGRVKLLGTKTGGHALLVAFRDAKLSLLEWDPERHNLNTVSIHFYEREDLQSSPWTPELSRCVNYLSVDPSSRCAALTFGVRNLAILPFRQAGDDLVMDDYDPDLDGPLPATSADSKATNGHVSHHEAMPYGSSFVLPLSALDPNLVHPTHLAFLHEYREPTFGILFSTASTSFSLLHERRDSLSYSVYTLDLEQRASTTILSVSNLPYDLYEVVSLPPPVGGALLIGCNELVHVDQAGKTNAVAVNQFARQSSSFSMADQSELGLKLERCVVSQLKTDAPEMLLILNTGDLAILRFRIDGRSVSGLSVQKVAPENGGLLMQAGPSCAAAIGRGRLFLGSEECDSIVLGCTWKNAAGSRRKSQVGIKEEDGEDDVLFENEESDDYDEDLYGVAAADGQSKKEAESDLGQSKSEEYNFRVHDSLLNVAPLRDVTLGAPAFLANGEEQEKSAGVTAELEIVAACGRGRAGGLAVLKREIDPKVVRRFDFPEAHGVWALSAKKPAMKGLVPQTDENVVADVGGYSVDAEYDRFMIVSKSGEESAIYALNSVGFEELKGTDFDPAAGATVDAGTLGHGSRVIQVLRGEVRSYDGDLGLSQIFPMADELTGAEPKVLSASFLDPYLLLVRDDSSIIVLEADSSGDLDELERGNPLLETKWLSGSLYADMENHFGFNTGDDASKSVLLFLLSAEGALQIYKLPSLDRPVYVADHLSYLPGTLSEDSVARRSSAKEALTEILVASLGDETAKSPYMILRTANDDLNVYEPFLYQASVEEHDAKATSSLRFLKLHNTHLSKSPAEAFQEADEADTERRNNPLRAVENIGGYSTVFMPGASPSFLIKSAASMPRILSLRGKPVRGMSGFHTGGCDRGWVYIDADGVVRVSQLPSDTNFAETGWAIRKVPLEEDVHAVTYHPPMQSYVCGTSQNVEFKLPEDDDYHHEWRNENISLRPQTEFGYIKLINAATWTVVDSVELGASELPMCVKTVNLEVSEETHERRQLVAVGTALNHGEDLPARGCIYIFEVITVVPEPGRPETNRKLRLIVKEEVKGAVTAISCIGTQGFLLAAQGQKCMVRGLKEDNTLLPVAFMDMMCYVSVAKELPGTGLCLMGDAVKGLWFVGYAEEPYKLTLFGKDTHGLEVMAADFLPDGNQLFMVVTDADCDLHVLQFDPEHPKSLSGHILLHRSVFHTGHFPSTMTLLPRTLPAASPGDLLDAMDTSPDSPTAPPQQLLLTAQDGGLALVTPISESQYRRMSALQTQLTNTLEHTGSLNPRAYRAAGGDSGRGVLDGSLLMRWMELGSQRRAELSGRVGSDEWVIRADLDAISGSGLGYC